MIYQKPEMEICGSEINDVIRTSTDSGSSDASGPWDQQIVKGEFRV